MTIHLKVLNKYFCLEKYNGGRDEVVPNPFELAKQYCLLDACNPVKDLPVRLYTAIQYEEDYPQIEQWRLALSYHNPPSKVSFRSNPKLFRELVEPMDFSKPYDPAAVEAIEKQFLTEYKKEIGAEELVAAELEIE